MVDRTTIEKKQKLKATEIDRLILPHGINFSLCCEWNSLTSCLYLRKTNITCRVPWNARKVGGLAKASKAKLIFLVNMKIFDPNQHGSAADGKKFYQSHSPTEHLNSLPSMPLESRIVSSANSSTTAKLTCNPTRIRFCSAPSGNTAWT